MFVVFLLGFLLATCQGTHRYVMVVMIVEGRNMVQTNGSNQQKLIYQFFRIKVNPLDNRVFAVNCSENRFLDENQDFEVDYDLTRDLPPIQNSIQTNNR